jgi:uncharacterized protein (DUF362 family)
MKRREFIKKSGSAVALAGAAWALPGMTSFAGKPFFPSDKYDLVAIKGGNPVDMFDQAIASLGGMEQYVKQGQTVVVKPNIGWDVIPARAANTNPDLVGRIVKHCLEAGAKEVTVFDNTCDKWDKCYTNSGIEKAVKDAGGKLAPGHTEGYYQQVDVPEGEKLTDAKVHELILESDVFINVPVLKSHSSARLTIAMKNLMGIVWDRMFWHRNDLHQCIADFTTYRKPDLNIVDAYNVMMKNGPRGVSEADVANLRSQLISTDIVAIDAAAAKLFGYEPDEVPYIEIADEMGIGTMDLAQLNINRIIL